MKNLHYILPLLILPFLFSCGPNQTDKKEAHASPETHNSDKAEIELQQGNKWKVNAEMVPHLKEAEQLLSEHISHSNHDYKALARQLKEHNNNLIASCTMKGKSHDELHKWLHPHLELVKQLENAASEEEAHQIIIKLNASFQLYHQFFN